MKRNQIALIFLTSVLLIFSTANLSKASITIGGTDYYRFGSSENVNAVFTQADGGVTTNTYSGLVELIVTGTGEASATRLNDAFYIFTDLAHNPVAPANSSQYYQLAVRTSTLQPFQPAFEAKHSIVYHVASSSEVTPTYVPGYNANHTYNFVVDLNTVSLNQLHFGVSNGNFRDNSGAFSIDVHQLAVVPVPGAIILGSLGIGLVGWLRRKKAI